MLLRFPHFKDPKQLAISFASAATASSSKNDWVARNGQDSLFAVFQALLPEVTKVSFRSRRNGLYQRDERRFE